MLARQTIVRALKRELEKTKLVHLPQPKAQSFDFLFIFETPTDLNLQQNVRDLIQKMGEALKLSPERWKSLELQTLTLDAVVAATSSMTTKYAVLFSSSLPIHLAGADLILADRLEVLLTDTSKKREIWEKLKAALGRL